MNTVGLKQKIVGLKAHVLPLLFLLLIPILINFRHLNEPPAYIHAWTQSDNYSLALGFQHNGGVLFHPQTLIFNKQQKGFDDPESLIGHVCNGLPSAVGFPWHDIGSCHFGIMGSLFSDVSADTLQG